MTGQDTDSSVIDLPYGGDLTLVSIFFNLPQYLDLAFRKPNVLRCIHLSKFV